jgi:hypothetical protein
MGRLRRFGEGLLNVGSCAGFRMAAMTKPSTRSTGRSRKSAKARTKSREARHCRCRGLDGDLGAASGWAAIVLMRHGFGGHPLGPDEKIARERHDGRVGDFFCADQAAGQSRT